MQRNAITSARMHSILGNLEEYIILLSNSNLTQYAVCTHKTKEKLLIRNNWKFYRFGQSLYFHLYMGWALRGCGVFVYMETELNSHKLACIGIYRRARIFLITNRYLPTRYIAFQRCVYASFYWELLFSSP